MRITCPSCGAAGRLKKPPTAPVRCPRCKERWDPRATEEKDAEEEEEEAAPARPRRRRKRTVEPGEGDRRPRKRARSKSRDRGAGDPERPAPRRRRARRGRPSSASGEREEHGRRGGRRRRSKATLPIIAGGIALVLIGAVGGTVMLLQRRGGGGGDTLRARAEAYVGAFRAADADAMFKYLHPSHLERIRKKRGEAGVKMLKSLLTLGANMLQSAQQAGAKIEVAVSKVTTNGARGTVELTTTVSHKGKTESRKNSMEWVNLGGKWYLSGPETPSPNLARSPTVAPSEEDDTAPDQPTASDDQTAPDGAAEEDDADVDITAPD